MSGSLGRRAVRSWPFAGKLVAPISDLADRECWRLGATVLDGNQGFADLLTLEPIASGHRVRDPALFLHFAFHGSLMAQPVETLLALGFEWY